MTADMAIVEAISAAAIDAADDVSAVAADTDDADDDACGIFFLWRRN